MDVLLLGTGAADGVPNLFCDCATCTDFRDRRELRTPTSVLVDGRLLIDPGPESPRQVARLGHDLVGLQAILVGHAHHDHLDPSLLMHRSWVRNDRLPLAGPAPVIETARHWLEPDQTAVELRGLSAGDVVELAGYRVHAFRANHEAFGEALVYRIESQAAALLYLTDTGLLPDATLDGLTGQRADLVLLEETFGLACGKGDQHLNLDSFAQTVTALRERGAIDNQTRVVAVHMGHDNPPLAELRERLAACGAEALPDGTLIQLGAARHEMGQN